MKDDVKKRIQAVRRFLAGEKPDAICVSMVRSKSWLYKWINRYNENDEGWHNSFSRRPNKITNRTPGEIETIIKAIRVNLHKRNLFCGAQAILWEMEDMGVFPLPSLRTINRILSRNNLIRRRDGKYTAKGTSYPKLPSLLANQSHQMDLIGPCYLTGPIRFYGLNVIDTATARCGLHSLSTKSGGDVLHGTWSIWTRIGIPNNIQVDNAMTFCGSPKYPRVMSQFVRLCLHHGVEPWFIPVSEPWRNGVIEKFNDLYRRMFLGKTLMATKAELRDGTLAFEQRHNSKYRYSKLGGKTPLKALAAMKAKLRFPSQEDKPHQRLKKPKSGRCHLVRLVRSDLRVNIFGEMFPVRRQ
ncbi:transposase [Candidatus Desulfarcum epimagneticum]|uniref:Transposase n=1 Tax=uncultured Desulfobacteraceae bacterium TaxID=218296 RepID=A0A484HK69_9BACT|nr:transposase [uncultured Desulfobacteraceae bacterium]